ncbi:hypothetical protein J437_LFUL000320 [Ladona fulva]|uniref:Large ribosomal subunit protein mL54 n=1 Tax=Ladona fulva TaxID=123851 RepID=A0A8K0P0U5_LADFU|nr:hypothetical protein J437_LFUL000320 [Ladona fulva]
MATLGKGIFRILLCSSNCPNAGAVYFSKKAVPVISSLGKSKKKLGKLGPAVEKVELPVESDPEKLVNYVCGSNILKKGEDIKLKPDNEYPSWLWDLRTGKPPPLEEYDKNDKPYWRRVRKLALWQNNKLAKLRKW